MKSEGACSVRRRGARRRKPIQVSGRLVFGQSRPELVLDEEAFRTTSIQADQIRNVPLVVTRLRMECLKLRKLDAGP